MTLSVKNIGKRAGEISEWVSACMGYVLERGSEKEGARGRTLLFQTGEAVRSQCHTCQM